MCLVLLWSCVWNLLLRLCSWNWDDCIWVSGTGLPHQYDVKYIMMNIKQCDETVLVWGKIQWCSSAEKDYSQPAGLVPGLLKAWGNTTTLLKPAKEHPMLSLRLEPVGFSPQARIQTAWKTAHHTPMQSSIGQEQATVYTCIIPYIHTCD